ncbi:MAG: DUF402 domain-containing protein [Anaerolineaceae bacterium]|nr:DUF402 domain-containing protein [Anaerolineaceae bacterium]
MKIIKNNYLGEKVWEYEGELIEKTDSVYLFKARFNRPDLFFNKVLLKKGDLFLELYPLGKWFNIYEIHDRDDDNIKAWYCNVTRPMKIIDGSVTYEDLALDLFVYPDRKMLVLDEDEFESLSISKREKEKAKGGLKELIDIFSFPEPFRMEKYRRFI